MLKLCTYNSEINPINQTNKFDGVTDKYKLIRTDKVIEVFQDNGLQVIGESVAKTRKKEREGFQKHLVAFSHDGLMVNGNQLQLLLTNSHDGTSSYQLDLGCFRFACANGLVSGDVESTIRIRHVGNCLDRLDEAIRYQLDRLPQIAAEIEAMQKITLEHREVDIMTLEAAKIRSGVPVDAIREVRAKRSADLGNDLYTVFNRVQEACLRGGLVYHDPTATDKKGNVTGAWKRARKITGVNSVVKINKELWNLAESFKKAA